MANPEHIEILFKGADTWNKWRRENPEVRPNLAKTNIRDASLRGMNLHYTSLSNSHLGGSDLSNSDLSNADLSTVILDSVDLSHANLSGAYLKFAKLLHTELNGTNLVNADLTFTSLYGAKFLHTRLGNTDFSNAFIDRTVFADVNLAEAIGLEYVRHSGPSEIAISTIYRSGGNIPKMFLRGCGIPEDFITYVRSLTSQPIEFYSCFISYSSKDQDFANRIYADLQSKGVRCWFAPEDMKIGDRFRIRIDESIHIYDKLLLVLSENSVSSSWVEKEVETAMEREQENAQQRTVLFPVRLDEAVMKIKMGWPADVRRTRHIGDFTRWKDHDSYQKAIDRLLRDLKAEEKKDDR
jgi:uncharacterized protein YjbI with pentapeptide repeats